MDPLKPCPKCECGQALTIEAVDVDMYYSAKGAPLSNSPVRETYYGAFCPDCGAQGNIFKSKSQVFEK